MTPGDFNFSSIIPVLEDRQWLLPKPTNTHSLCVCEWLLELISPISDFQQGAALKRLHLLPS